MLRVNVPAKPADVRERIRVRIVARLAELNMTAREFAIRCRPGEKHTAHLDSWVSGILKGAQALSWKHFDLACEALGLSPGELVREAASELRELRPHEARMLRLYQDWPADQQAGFLHLLEFISGTATHRERPLLRALRALPAKDLSQVLTLIERLQSRTR
jgi:hypothetical protein